MKDFKTSFWNKTVSAQNNLLTVLSADGQQKKVILSQDCFPAKFKDAKISGINFSQFDICDSDFANANIIDCNFSGCDLRGVSFFGATLINCNFIGAKICSNGPVSWHTKFPDDISSCIFDDAGIKSLKDLDKISADGIKRADAWMKRHPIRQQWEPGSKLDSPWN